MDTRQLVVATIVILVLFGARTTAAQEADPAAQTAAESWLALVDGDQYAESWRQAAAAFRNAITAEQWQQAVTMARSPLGRLESREVRSATPMTSLPGAPDGDWRVVGYVVR